MTELEAAQQTICQLREEVKDLTMSLSAIKVITTKITPVCSGKLAQILEECEGCREEEDVN